MAGTSSHFLVDKRELDFVLFEHIQVQSILNNDYFKEHTKDSLREMISSAILFCEQVIGPLNRVGDREGCHYDKISKKVTTPKGTKESYQAYIENGFLTLADDEAAHGLQVPSSLAACFMELFSSANQAFTMYPGLTKSCSHVLWKFGTDWMKKICVSKIAEGKWLGTMCLTEASAGSAVGDLKSSAQRNSDGTFQIKALKQWISGGENEFAENILHLVLARIEGAPEGIDGVSLFLVPKKKFDLNDGSILADNDVYCVSLEEKMGIHGNSTCFMAFGDKSHCVGYLIGKENQGIHYMFLMMNEARIGVGLQGVGQASVGYLNAHKYALERVQGVDINVKRDVKNPPRVSIIQHPDVKRMLLRQRAIVEGSRALAYLASHYYDLSIHEAKEEDRIKYHDFLELLTPVVKTWGTEMGFQSLTLSLQTYGGYGYTKDFPIEQLMRDCKIATIYEGTSGIQALDFVGRKMRAKDGNIMMSWLERISEFLEKNQDHKNISKECELLAEVLGRLGQSALHMSEISKIKDRRHATLNCFPYLMAFGHVTICQLLLEQALISSKNLDEKKYSTYDKKFYENKIKTAKFFANHILPEAKSFLDNVDSDDYSALTFEF